MSEWEIEEWPIGRVIEIKTIENSECVAILPLGGDLSDEEVRANAQIIVATSALKAENERLKEERAALLEACEALVAEAGDVFAESDYGDIYCVLCGEDQLTNERVHDPDCPIEKARRAIAMVKRGEEAEDEQPDNFG